MVRTRTSRTSRSGALRAAVAGVSLLELIIVLMIMALVTAVVIPMLGSGVSNIELRSAARQLAAGLRLARSEALAQRDHMGAEAGLLVERVGVRVLREHIQA